MALPPTLTNIFKHIDDNKDAFINDLREAVAIKSVSAWADTRDEVIKMMKWAEDRLKKLKAKTELADIGTQKLPDGRVIPLPPALLASLGEDPQKKTLLVYAHLDVQPAAKEDGWNTDPFTLVEQDGKLFGRGSSDDKGASLAWMHVVQSHQDLGQDIPVNLKFVFEGMEENGSRGLDQLLWSRKDTFLKDVDYVCISDSVWLGPSKPCITYGLRGTCYFELEVSCANSDLHSGFFGGNVYEAMTDLIYLMGTLVDLKGRILVDDIYENVRKVTPEEVKIYESIDFDGEEFKRSIGAAKLLNDESKVQLLMSRWRHPTLSLHGIERAFSEPGAKTVIPGTVVGKFSLRIVPDMTPQEVEKKVVKYINEKWQRRESPNKMKVFMSFSGRPWLSNPDHPHFKAAKSASKHVYKVEPDLIRAGGTIPVTLTFQEVTGKNVLLFPMAASDDGAHSQNEKVNVRNYIEGTKVFATYLYEISKI